MSIKTMELQIEKLKLEKELSKQRHEQKMKELEIKLKIEQERKHHTVNVIKKKPISKGVHEPENIKKYLNSCHWKGDGCEIRKLSKLQFKIFEREEIIK